MREGIRVGRLVGVDIVIDWSWVFIAVLLSWNLTTVFWTWHPAWGIENLALAIVAAVCFFASVLAHELGHALVAKAYGLRVSEIRLFLFGGVSNIEHEPPSPRAELLIALVGPAVSFGIGIWCIVMAGLLVGPVDPRAPWATIEALGPISTILYWLGPINVIIGLFNLIPGFPLDGGRVLRAALWAITRDLRKATFWASNVGRVVGWTFVMMGFAMLLGARLPLFGQGTLGGVWLALIGWFLSSAASRSYRGLVIEDVLKGVRVGELMRHAGPGVSVDTTVADAVAQWFMRSTDRVFPVLRDGDLAGVVSIRDVHRVPQETWSTATVASIMTPRERLVTTSPGEEATPALRKLAEADVKQLPVLDEDGLLVGVLEERAVALWLELQGPGRASTSQTRRNTPRTA